MADIDINIKIMYIIHIEYYNYTLMFLYHLLFLATTRWRAGFSY